MEGGKKKKSKTLKGRRVADPVRRSKVKKKEKKKHTQCERRDPHVHRGHGWTPEPPLCVFFINVPISTGHAAPDQRGRVTMTND